MTHPSSSVIRLQQYDRIHAAHHRAMMDWLALAPGNRVLDAGCGAGGMTTLLAEAVGAQGRVAALDSNAQHLAATREALGESGFADRASLHEGSLLAMPFDAGEFDLVWCSRVVHHLPDQLAAVRALIGVTKLGGCVVLREGGLPARFLPFDLGIGEPGLESRLQVIQDQWFTAHVRSESSDHIAYPFGWAQLLRDAGCVDVRAKSFLFEAESPLNADLMEYGLQLLQTRLTNPEIAPRLVPNDRQTIELLLDPSSAHYLARRNDLHWLVVSSLYVGWIPAGG